MLHIILGILKVIGILAGVLLLFLLAVVLALLLVPVRYQVEALKKEQIADVSIRVNWLLYLVSVSVSTGIGRKLSILIRVAGMDLPFFDGRKARQEERQKERKNDRQKNQKNVRQKDRRNIRQNDRRKVRRNTRKNDPQRDRQDSGQNIENLQDRDAAARKSTDMPGAAITDINVSQKEIKDISPQNADETKPAGFDAFETDVRKPDSYQMTESEKDSAADQIAGVQANVKSDSEHVPDEETDPESDQPEENDSDTENSAEKEKNTDSINSLRMFIRNVCLHFRALGRRIRGIWKRICHMADAIAHLPAKIRQLKKQFQKRLELLGKRIRRMRERPAEFLDFIEEYEVMEAVAKFKKELQYLLRHFRPRRIRGYLEFGTGDPAQTGQLTGVIYLLLPARADQFEVRPDFYETRFETDVVCAGHIRAAHLLCTAFRVLKDQKIRRLIRKFTRKGE